MKRYSLDTFGPTFPMMTVAFVDSGKERFEIPCDTKGQAVNIRMRFHQFWRMVLASAPDSLAPDLKRVQRELADLVMLADPKRPMVSIMARKSQRQMDSVILRAMQKMRAPSQDAPNSSPDSAVAALPADAMTDVLDTAYGVK